jgi:LysM repeat protein
LFVFTPDSLLQPHQIHPISRIREHYSAGNVCKLQEVCKYLFSSTIDGVLLPVLVLEKLGYNKFIINMNTEISQEAKTAIKIAVKAMQNGDKKSANHYAKKAAAIDPNLEYAWLILAEVSSLNERARYLEQAIRINPGRASSHDNLKVTLDKIHQKISQETTFEPSAKKSNDRVEIKENKPKNSRIIFLFGCITIGLVISLTWGKTDSVLASIMPNQQNVLPGIQENWSDVEISKPTQTPTATPTSTPIPTFTSTPVPTEIPTQDLQKNSDPAAIQISGDKYIVQAGDTLFKISQKLGVNMDDLATVNSINVHGVIYTGQSLVIPAAGYVSVSTPIPDNNLPPETNDKYVLVDISEQHLYAYESGLLVYSFVASTGMNNATRVGVFSVLDKIPNAYGATWNIWMPNWLGIYWAGTLENGIHALPILSNGSRLWAGYLGTPISYGCVVLGVNESQLLYDWVTVGTPVEIQW